MAIRVAFIKNTDITDAHGWVFSRIIYSCAAAYCLGLMRRRRKGSPRIFRMRSVACSLRKIRLKSKGPEGYQKE